MEEQVKVSFLYDDATRKWEVEVEGTVDPTETMQAFNAVVVTCCDPMIDTELRHEVTRIVDRPNCWKLEPAVIGG
jgi:hypothetical protein